MEKALLEESESQAKESNQRWEFFEVELEKVSYLAAPMVWVSVSQYLLQVVAMMMAGHLGQAAWYGWWLGNFMWASLRGRAISEVGNIYTYCGIISLAGVSLPVCLLWIFMDKLLLLMGQYPEIATVAGRYLVLFVPALFGQSVIQPLVRYFQTQGLILPILFAASAVLCFHIPICWALVFKLELGSTGAACDTAWNLCEEFLRLKTRVSFSIDVFLSIKDFFCFAVP